MIDDIPSFFGVDLPTIKRCFEVQFSDGMTWDSCKKSWSLKNRFRLSDFDHPSVAMSFMTNPKSVYHSKVKSKFVECEVDFLWKDNIETSVPWW